MNRGRPRIDGFPESKETPTRLPGYGSGSNRQGPSQDDARGKRSRTWASAPSIRKRTTTGEEDGTVMLRVEWLTPQDAGYSSNMRDHEVDSLYQSIRLDNDSDH